MSSAMEATCGLRRHITAASSRHTVLHLSCFVGFCVNTVNRCLGLEVTNRHTITLGWDAAEVLQIRPLTWCMSSGALALDMSCTAHARMDGFAQPEWNGRVHGWWGTDLGATGQQGLQLDMNCAAHAEGLLGPTKSCGATTRHTAESEVVDMVGLSHSAPG